MALLRLWCVALGATACYAPELRDCVTSCELEADCPPGQVCGDDRMCAAPPSAGRCSALAVPDGRQADGSLGDASADASSLVAVRVRIQGHRKVLVEGVGMCDSESSVDHGDCTFGAPAGSLPLHAIPGDDRLFEGWTSSACGGQGPDCALVLAAPLTEVKARFRMLQEVGSTITPWIRW